MLKRLRLDRTTRAYENAFAAREISRMLVAYLDGTPGPRSVGCEQEPIGGWDDVVREENTGTFVHYQVKRQLTPFDGTYVVDRHAKLVSKGAHTGDLGLLSPLDESLAALAVRVQAGTIGSTPNRRFAVVVPSLSVKIKGNLEVRTLRELCVACTGVAQSAVALEARARTDEPTNRTCKWLTSWCGFGGWEEIFLVLQRLEILEASLENELASEIDEILAARFSSGAAVRTLLTAMIDSDSDAAGPFAPRMVLDVVRHLLRADRPTWTQFQCGGAAHPWLISGTHGPAGEGPELPSAVVQALWLADGSARALRVASPWVSTHPNLLPRALARLALHLPPPAQALVAGVGAWQEGVRSTIGGTLGNAHEGPILVAWADYPSPLNPFDTRPVVGIASVESEAGLLRDAMDHATWTLLIDLLAAKIADVAALDVRGAIEARWNVWRVALESDLNARGKLLADLLCVAAEGGTIDGRIRVGPRTVQILTHGLFLLLVVAAAIGDADATWSRLSPGRDVRTVALVRWSRSVAGVRTIVALDEYPAELLRHEVAKVVVLAGVEAPESAVLEETIGHDAELADNFASPRCQRRLVTSATKLRHLLNVTDPLRAPLQEIRTYLQRNLALREEMRERHISANYPGAVNG